MQAGKESPLPGPLGHKSDCLEHHWGHVGPPWSRRASGGVCAMPVTSGLGTRGRLPMKKMTEVLCLTQMGVSITSENKPPLPFPDTHPSLPGRWPHAGSEGRTGDHAESLPLGREGS